jgi:DNA processing protein
MGVCDVPVISSVCDAVGEGPPRWSRPRSTGSPRRWAPPPVAVRGRLVGLRHHHPRRCHQPGYVAVYNLLFGIAVFVMLIFFCLQLITGLIRRDPPPCPAPRSGWRSRARVVRRHHSDGAAAGSRRPAVHRDRAGRRETTESMGDKIALLAAGWSASTSPPPVGAIITIFLAGLAITAAAIVWLSLLVRKALLLVAIVFAPLAFSGRRGTPRGGGSGSGRCSSSR